MNRIVMSEELGIKLIEDFIFEKTGRKIKANRPTDPIQLQLFHEFSWIAYEYFESKKDNPLTP